MSEEQQVAQDASPESTAPAGERSFNKRSGSNRFYKKKVCKFCAGKTKPDYKEAEALKRFTTEKGKILPARITGTCAKHQRMLANEIKRARYMALMPFKKD